MFASTHLSLSLSLSLPLFFLVQAIGHHQQVRLGNIRKAKVMVREQEQKAIVYYHHTLTWWLETRDDHVQWSFTFVQSVGGIQREHTVHNLRSFLLSSSSSILVVHKSNVSQSSNRVGRRRMAAN